MRRIIGLIAIWALAACGAAGERAQTWSITERPPEEGAYYGTFQSHLPTFASAGGALYRSRTVDIGASHAGQARTETVELRIDRLTNGTWSTVFRRSGYLNPACLVADGGVVYAVVSDQRSFALSIVTISGENVAETVRERPLATASKVNCAIYDGALLFMTTYGDIATFDLESRRFLPDRAGFVREYAPGLCTHYPHVSVHGDQIFLGHNTVRCTQTGAGYVDLIGYAVRGQDEIGANARWTHLLPPELRGQDIWIADTWLTERHFYFAGRRSQCAPETAPDPAATENPSCSAAFFGICSEELGCRIQYTEIGQGLSGTFLRYGRELYFFGEGFRRINVWRMSADSFTLEAQIAHGVRCPYAFSFAPVFDGVVEGQVTDMGRCSDGVDRHVSFTLRRS